jgi:GTP cyclohydrolase I
MARARNRSGSPPDIARMERAMREWLVACGLDPDHADVAGTPARVARLWASELLDGYAADPVAILGDPVVGEADPDVVVVAGLRFHAMCPHHLFPYRGLAHVAYLPAGKLVGFGRLGKLVECFAHRLTLQERITQQIAEALMAQLDARGAAVVVEAEQLCLALPGDRHDSATVTTSVFLGEAAARPDVRARLFAAVQDR